MDNTKLSIVEAEITYARFNFNGTVITFAFTNFPTKEELEYIIMRTWRKAPQEMQDANFHIPIFFEGIEPNKYGHYENLFGELDIYKRVMFVNGELNVKAN